MSDLYYEAKKEAESMTKSCDITDSEEIRGMTEEYLEKKVIKNMKLIIESLSMTTLDKVVISGVTEALRTTHRYTQGEFWGSMLKIIKAYGEQEHFDARNEWAVKMCQRMAIAGENPQTDELLDQYIKDHRPYYEK